MNTDLYKDYILQILSNRLSTPGLEWLQKQLNNLATEKDFYLAFSMAPRFTGKMPLNLSAAELQQAQQLRPGFNPASWTLDQASRTLLILSMPHVSPEDFARVLNKVFSTADLNESATLYAALPLLPYPESHVKRAAEGVRTTMTQVFDAIALHNPYPYDYLPEAAWNQLVIKSVFNVRPLHQIYGLDVRRNENLAHMLVDYAHERWAAGRTLTPELWRLVGPFIKLNNIPDLEKLFNSPEVIQRQAAALAISESNLPEAKALLDQHPPLKDELTTQAFTWETIGKKAYA